MCRIIAKYGLIAGVLAAAGFMVGALLTMVGYIALWWEFPGTWQPLTGLSEAPRAVLALRAPENLYLLQTARGALFTCDQGSCVPANADWGSEALACDNTTRPAVVSFFPVILSRDIQVALGCERGYQSTGRTVYIVYDRHGTAYYSGGSTMIPTDAGVIIVGFLGGLVGAVLALVGLGLAGIVLVAKNRARERGRLAGENL